MTELRRLLKEEQEGREDVDADYLRAEASAQAAQDEVLRLQQVLQTAQANLEQERRHR